MTKMTENFENFITMMNKMGENKIPFLFIIDYEMINPVILPLSDAAKEGIYYAVNGQRNFSRTIFDAQPLQFRKKPIDFPAYQIAFNKVQDQIHFGNTFLLNLTFPTEIETNWSLRRIFESSRASYRLLYKDQFVLFSPECFIQTADGVISSYPMKGTIDAAIAGAADLIMTDEKEKAEHATIVDLIRNDLSMVAHHVTVKKYRYLEEIITHSKNLLQVSSQISGYLPVDYQANIGTILSKLLPAGSICGAPKESTLKIIQTVENYRRGYYTGVFGIFDGVNLDSAVMIRYIEQSEGRLWYKSGGGITMNSNPEKEYRELIDKVYVATY
jgi:para-aminobenzoate synthetase component I